MESNRKILLTGSGPFFCRLMQDSVFCAHFIQESGLQEELNVEIVTGIIDMIYDNALKRLKFLWSENNPFMVVHIGVHEKNEFITVEKCARKMGYFNRDVFKNYPPFGISRAGKQKVIYTEIDVDEIISKCTPGPFKVCSSHDAGLSVGEYTYFASLSRDPSRVLFIQIPSRDVSNQVKEKAIAVKEIVKLAYLERQEMWKIANRDT